LAEATVAVDVVDLTGSPVVEPVFWPVGLLAVSLLSESFT
jgi:hypothetical protein